MECAECLHCACSVLEVCWANELRLAPLRVFLLGRFEMNLIYRFLLFVLLSVSANVYSASQVDVVKISLRESAIDHRANYLSDILDTALRVTEGEYGPYRIETVKGKPSDPRMLRLLSDGDSINTAIAVTRQHWENEVLVVRVPVRMGLLNYRLLAIHRDNIDLFKSVKTADDLKALRAGLQLGWSTVDTMQKLGFPVVLAYDYESTFAMLNQKRFEYFPRGAHEVFYELRARKKDYPDLVVAPDIAIHIPAPVYFFVSPKFPRLAKRIEDGLHIMIEKGLLRHKIDMYFADDIERADFENRRIIDLGNELLPHQTPLEKPKYWLDFGLGD